MTDLHETLVDIVRAQAPRDMGAVARELEKALQSAFIRIANAYDFCMADIPDGGHIPLPIACLEDEMRFIRAALAKAAL